MTSRLLTTCVTVFATGALLAGCPPETPPAPTHDASSGADAAALDSAGVDGQQADAAGRDHATADAGADSGEPACEDECSPGTQNCDGTSGYRLCGQYDLDPCHELSPSVTCAVGYGCTDGRCVPSCRNECPAGGTLCQGAAQVLTCGNFDTDPCLDLGAAIDCGSGRHCEAGQCVLDGTACSDECSASGATVCFGDTVRTCGQSDADSCLDLSAPVTCDSGQVCGSGACIGFCLDECSSSGATECAGNGVRTCGETDADGCLEWSAPIACPAPATCSGGVCATTCADDCANNGSNQCSDDNSGVAWCGQFDRDACLDLSTPTPCPLGYACDQGVCSPTCFNDCALGGAPRCGGDGHSVETCGNYDQDVCAEWGGAVTCPGGATCTSGSCDTPCTDGCTPVDLVECISGDNATHTCGQWDLDSCLEWTSTPASCEVWQVCDVDQCVTGPTPATILINEILYNPNGTDSDPNNNLFVELWGPADQSLDGYELVGVNGNGGGDYNRISLDGEVMGTDRYYLIAHPSGESNLVQMADKTSTNVDYQNGPDSLQLRWHGRVVDAIGYGTFGSGDVFAGEGTAAPSSGQGASLSRDSAHADTDHNNADFSTPLAPSPRGDPPSCSDDCPTINAQQCSGTQIQTCLTNVDSDPCLEWSLAADCPVVGQTCNSNNHRCESATCGNECNPGTDLPQCGGNNNQQIRACVTNADPDSCYEWSPFGDCSVGGEVCIGGACTSPCNNDCPSFGVTRCAANGQLQVCGDTDTDPCYEWRDPANCSIAGQTCINDSCQATNAPEVRLIAPQGTLQTTQGNVHRILVDATAASGRSISRVEYYADNVKQGQTTALPHEFYFTVPAGAQTGSTIALQAKAVDDQNVWGNSSFAYLDVRNDLPVASFTATITNIVGNTGTVTVDANAVTDTETASGQLQVCWDWDNSGQCDAAFSTAKITTHEYPAPGTYTIRMVVQDAVGQQSETTREVTFTSIQYVGQPIAASTLWYGTVIITGDVTVNTGVTLTIAESTQVLFVFNDADTNGIGDYTFDVAGQLIVNGTAANPVVFTGQSQSAKQPGGWDRIILRGSSASQLTHTIIEYADVGLDIRNASTLDQVTVRSTRGDCIQLNNADNATLTDVDVNHCGGNGVSAFGASTGVLATRLASTQNGGHGVSVWENSAVGVTDATLAGNSNNGARTAAGSTLDLSGSTVENNVKVGVAYVSSAVGVVTHNQIRQNGAEGIGLIGDSAGNPNPVVTYNNVYSNATTASDNISTVDTSGTLTASYTCCGSTGATSTTYSAPAASVIRRVYVSYDETDNSSNYVNGYLINGTTGTTIRTFSADFAGWVLLPDGVTQLRVRTADTGWDYVADTITATQVELMAPDGAADIVAITDSGTIDLRYNYLGTFPNVLSRIVLSRTDALNLQGFVGAAFDGSWDRGPYKAGPYTSATWSGTIYITGDVTIAAGQRLTIAAGSSVQFVDHDQNGDGAGDFSIAANGGLDLAGASGNLVVVQGYGAPAGDAYQRVVLAGSAADRSTWSHVEVQDGLAPLRIQGDSILGNVAVHGGSGDAVTVTGSGAALSDLTIDGTGGRGLVLDNGDNVQVLRATVETGAGHGIVLTNGSTGSTLGRLTVRTNAGVGVLIDGASTATVEDSTIRENGGDGVQVVNSAPTLHYNLIVYNGSSGLRFIGTGAAATDHNVIKFNGDAGAVVLGTSDGSPTPTIQYSNIYNNAVTGSTQVENVDTSATLTASYDCCGSTGTTSATYSAPTDKSIRRVYVSYDETDNSSNYVNGYLINGATGANIRTFSSDFAGWVMVPAGVTQLRVRTADTGWDYVVDTITVTQVELLSVNSSAYYDLASITDSGVTQAQNNFWTSNVGDVPSKIFQSRVGAVNYDGYTGTEYGGGEVGPRP